MFPSYAQGGRFGMNGYNSTCQAARAHRREIVERLQDHYVTSKFSCGSIDCIQVPDSFFYEQMHGDMHGGIDIHPYIYIYVSLFAFSVCPRLYFDPT